MTPFAPVQIDTFNAYAFVNSYKTEIILAFVVNIYCIPENGITITK